MCGIVGYVGPKQASGVLFDCLTRLEYRGYDSCGIAVEHDTGLKVYKESGRVSALKESSPTLTGTTGIGHSRWATHGHPTKVNAHPHLDCSGRIAVVHNGVISNYAKIKQQLTAEGHHFISDTDTEVISHLIEKYYVDDLSSAVAQAVAVLEGSYAIAVISHLDAGMVIVARKDSPLVIGNGKGEKFVASDMPAIINYCNNAIYLENGDVGTITCDNIIIRNNGVECIREEQLVDWCRDDSDKCGYEHFMLKEIHEQPKVILNTIQENASFDQNLAFFDGAHDLSIVACGTSYHAGLIGAYIIEELLGIVTRVTLGSEFNHRRVLFPDEALVLTQSGETADVLYAMRALKIGGIKVMAVTNVPGSTANRLADRTVYIKAGTEFSVAATKSFTGQLIALCQIVLAQPTIPEELRTSLSLELGMLPDKVLQVFKIEPEIVEIAKYMANFESAFFIGRGINYPVALEGALKLKEVSYIHAEGYAAGELKHGPLALIHEGMPVVAMVIADANYDSMITSIIEARARKAYVIAIAASDVDGIDGVADVVIRVPHTNTLLSPIINTIPLQLLAYHIAKIRGCAIDHPRNLAKSVTVE
ncbi:MAG: glutamine--fructose-6-phosphate transaminase (isomerizing) [Dehalogenimonas sp.]